MTRQDARVTAERCPFFQHTDFSDIWQDAQRTRTAFARACVERLLRQIRRAQIGRTLASRRTNPGTPDAR